MKINIDYYPTWQDITVQTGWWNEGYFEMETCNHAGMEKHKAYTFDGFSEGYYYECDKCDESWADYEIESDDDWAYQSWKDSQL